jgi:microcystin degradation protein MlrC
MRILTAEFSHETNRFSVRPTDLAAFRARHLLEGEAALAARGEANTELAGFLDVLRPAGAEIVHAITADAEPSGLVTDEAFEHVAGRILDAARQGRFDGVALGLHGAMVTQSHDDAESELLQRLRDLLGPKIPIAITLDLHANVTARLCRLAEIVVSFKTYPHTDMREAGRHAATLLLRRLRGEIDPVTRRVAIPEIEEPSGLRTDKGPMVDWAARARAYEKEPGVYAVSINGGFGAADIEDVGPSVLVTAERGSDHGAFACALAREIWERRAVAFDDFLTPEAAAALARGWSGEKPLVIADYGDNPGAGAYGDSTSVLQALLAAGVTNACFGPLIDPAAAAELHRHRPGERLRIALGGKTDPRFGGPPLDLGVTLLGLYDGWFTGDGPMIGGQRYCYGPTAAVAVDGLEILVVTNAGQMLDLQQFKAFGIAPETKRAIALKSQQHFRAAFAPIAGRIVVADGGGLSTADLSRFPFTRVRRPIYPLDPDMTFEPKVD